MSNSNKHTNGCSVNTVDQWQEYDMNAFCCVKLRRKGYLCDVIGVEDTAFSM